MQSVECCDIALSSMRRWIDQRGGEQLDHATIFDSSVVNDCFGLRTLAGVDLATLEA